MMTSLLHKADKIAQNAQAVTNDNDHWRPKFHISPVVGLLNDPNGFIEHDGQYHLFFQWNPLACEHGAKYWAHCVSTDLMHWDYQPTALAPDESYDQHGCYSGSAFSIDGVLHLFYTGNLKNEQGERFSSQCLVRADNAKNETFTKIGPVIHQPPKGYTAHFRDPKIWQHEQKWYCVIGAQTEEELGQVLLYMSDNAYDWTLVGPIAGNKVNGLNGFGYMFECPDLFSLDDRDILIGCPQGIEPRGTLFQNAHNNGYFVGNLDYQTYAYEHGDFRPLDQGFEFYAPQTTSDSKGRRLLSAWVGIPEEDDQPTVEKGWIHTLSLVRELRLEKDRIYQLPAEEHKSLRQNKFELNQVELSAQHPVNFDTDNCFELEICAENIEQDLTIRLADDGDSCLAITFDAETNTLVMDRISSDQMAGKRECQLLPSATLQLQIFFDRSIVEVFVNNGEEVLTSRVFPKSPQSKVSLLTESSCIINRLVKYDY